LTEIIADFLCAFRQPQYINWDASIQDICKKLILGKIHHLWLIDASTCCPTGIITMSDVLHMVCQSRSI
jgi:predicted transcriptional regulator